MKFIKKVFLLATPFLLAACTENLTQEEVGTEALANGSDVKNYEVEIALEVIITDLESEERLSETLTTMDVQLDEETLDGSGKITSETFGETLTQDYYSAGDQAFMKLNDGAWTDVSDQQEEYFHNTDTLYPELLPIVEVMVEEGEMTHEDGQYIFTYDGSNDAIYEAFEGPFSLTFGNIPTNTVNQDITLMIDEETLFIDSLSNRLSAEQEGQSFGINIDVAYKNINNVDDFTIPQDVIDEAAQH